MVSWIPTGLTPIIPASSAGSVAATRGRHYVAVEHKAMMFMAMHTRSTQAACESGWTTLEGDPHPAFYDVVSD